jgi:hypothetical protein
MCFNPETSLISFSIGFVSWIILLYLKLYNTAIIVIDLFIIQLLEYFAHKSITDKNEFMNILSSKLIFIFVLIQPLVYYISSFFANTRYIIKSAPNYLFLIPIYIIICTIFYFYLNSKNLFKTTYLNDSCKSICRLSWDYFGYNKIFTFIIFILYFIICGLFLKPPTLHYYAEILILIAIIYTLFLSREIKTMFSIFGSIWCFLSVTYGPLVIMKYYKLF